MRRPVEAGWGGLWKEVWTLSNGNGNGKPFNQKNEVIRLVFSKNHSTMWPMDFRVESLTGGRGIS